MSTADEARLALLALRLLLDEGSAEVAHDVDWSAFLTLARRNTVLIRLAARLSAIGVQPPEFWARAVEEERLRVQETIELIQAISSVCDSLSSDDFVFPKAFLHY